MYFNKKILNFRKTTLLQLIIVVGFILAIGIFAFVFFRSSTYKTVTIKVGSNSILWDRGTTKAWFSGLFYPGMKEQDGLGSNVAEVLSIRSYDTDQTMKSVYLTTKIKVVYNRASNQYSFRGKPLLIGSTVRMYLDRLLVEGLVVSIEGIKDTRETKQFIITAEVREENPVFSETSGVRPYFGDIIKKGMEIKDSNEQVLIKVLDTKVGPADKYVSTSDGRLIRQNQPNKISLQYELEVTGVKIHDRYYVLDDIPLLVGNNIPLNTSTVALFPEITSIKEK